MNEMVLIILVSFLMSSIPVLIYVYMKMTIGICKCSKQMVGKVVIVTGGTMGIGFETARDLADRGARVILACQKVNCGNDARNKIIAMTGNSDVHQRFLDLSSLSSVRKFAENILESEERLDVLINNAGIYGSNNVKTEDGLLLGMQTNHFGPFLLTCLLLPLLKSSAPSRIITVTSSTHKDGVIELNNLNMELVKEKILRKYQVYANSKLCNILMTVELDRRLKGTGVTANCVHPGIIATKILNDIDSKIFKFILLLIRPYMKSVWEGAQTTIYLAVSPDVKEVSGQYFQDCQTANVTTKQARDPVLAQELWKVSENLVHLK